MADEADESFVFNGVDGVSGDYLFPTLTAKGIVALAKGTDDAQKDAASRFEASGLTGFAPPEGVDPTLLDQSGWGVIFGADVEPAVREALQPLLDHRKAQAGDLYRELVGGDGYREGERKAKFLKRHKAPTSGPVDPEKLPYYLLLVGSPEAIPTNFQAQLGLQYAVGRLHFDTPEEYDNYARGVLACETGDVTVARRMGLFGPRNRNDRATSLSSEGLIGGLEAYMTKRTKREGAVPWSFDVWAAEQANKARLGAVLNGTEPPAVLFTASHGVGFPCGHEDQRRHQGALLCQDWGGPRSGPMSPDYYFAAEDLGDSAQLAGLISFFFACYGGGMPQYDAFAHGRSQRKQLAPNAFLAALPQRMLGHPRGGALATVGHIERAWGSSFYEPGGGHQIGMFESFMERLFKGEPIGHAMAYFGGRYGELSAGLLQKLEDLKYGESISEVEIANDWTATCDARNYVVLGDPAVRVPAADDGAATERSSLELRSVVSEPAPEASSPSAAAVPQGNEDYGLFGRKSESESESESGSGGVGDSLAGFVSKLGKTISSALDDMMSLEVRTYVADELDQVTVDDGKLQGAQLRAYTRVNLDGDTVVCLPQRDGEIDQEAFDIHMKTVEQAQRARAELMNSVVAAAASLAGITK